MSERIVSLRSEGADSDASKRDLRDPARAVPGARDGGAPATHPRAHRGRLTFAAASLAAVVSTPLYALDPGAVLAAKGNGAGVPPCSSCHGVRGEGNPTAGFPRLAGLGKAYIERQLDAFASGTRQNPVMAPIAKAMNASDRIATAAYYARMTWGASSLRGPSARDGEALATRGRWDSATVPACEQCHGPNGVGVGDAFPPLQGQSAAYIGQQLRAWQQGTRPPGPLGLMKAIAARLSAQEVDAVAGYFGADTPSDADRKAKP